MALVKSDSRKATNISSATLSSGKASTIRSRPSLAVARIEEPTEEDSDPDEVPAHKLHLAPLHLRRKERVSHGGKLKKVPEIVKVIPIKPPPVVKVEEVRDVLGELIREKSPWDPIYISWGLLAFRSIAVFCWGLLAAAILAVIVVRYYDSIENDLYNGAADGVVLRLEVNVSDTLGSALTTARSLALNTRSGIFNDTDPISTITLLGRQNMLGNQALLRIQAVGIATGRIVVLPGTVNVENPDPGHKFIQDVKVYLQPSDTCTVQAPYDCLGINTTNLVPKPSSQDGLEFAWAGPTFLTTDASGNPLATSAWIPSLNLVGLADPSQAVQWLLDVAPPTMPIILEVAIDVVQIQKAVKELTPADGGSLFVVTKEGDLVAASGAKVSPTVDQNGNIRYPKLWDLRPKLPWLARVTSDRLTANNLTITKYGRLNDMVLVKPLDSRFAGNLRAVLYLPHDTAIRKELRLFITFSFAVLASPPGASVFFPIFLLLRATWWWCRHRAKVHPLEEEDESDSASESSMSPGSTSRSKSHTYSLPDLTEPSRSFSGTSPLSPLSRAESHEQAPSRQAHSRSSTNGNRSPPYPHSRSSTNGVPTHPS